MIAKLVNIGLYKGYVYLIKHISTDTDEINYFREIFEGMDIDNDWYNGYVILPKKHELVDKFYGDFEEDYDLKVHGGITFSNYLRYVIDLEKIGFENRYTLGFDCNHAGDNPVDCNQEYVENECKKLIDQLINLDDCRKDNKNESEVIRNIDSKTRLVVKRVLSDKAFWVIEENHQDEWVEVLKICINQADVDSLVNFYLENRRRSLDEN